MRHLVYILAIVTLSVTLPSCSPWTVKTDLDPDINFAELKTYTVARNTRIPNDVLAQEEITRKRLIIAIENELQEKGYTAASDSSTADLTVLTYAGVKERVNYSTIGMNYGGYWRWGGPGIYSTQVVENRYMEGTLHIDIFDNKKKLLAWQGQATGAFSLQQADTPEERQAVANDIVDAILSRFPAAQK
jgi:hypothetical protein